MSAFARPDSTHIDIPSTRNGRDIEQHTEVFDYNFVKDDDFKQEIYCMDISTGKDWISYITKLSSTSDDTPPGWYLTISQFQVGNQNALRYSFDVENAFDLDISKACMFLSISPDGSRVAISFMSIDDLGIQNVTPSRNPECLIYRLVIDGNSCVLRLEKSFEFQGRAVFSKSGNLMLINKYVLRIYDKNYKEKSKFDLHRSFGANKKLPVKQFYSATDYTLQPHWAWTSENLETIRGSDIKDIIILSRHMRHNVLITPYKKRAHVWSITENGVRLTSILKKENEEIMAFSDDYKFLATYVNNIEREVNIYNVKSGMLLYTLKPRRQVQKSRTFEATYIRFCPDGRYLVIAGMEKNNVGEEAEEKVEFEVWHVESEQSIYSNSISTRLSCENSKTFSPFVMLRSPSFNSTTVAAHQPNTNSPVNLHENVRPSAPREQTDLSTLPLLGQMTAENSSNEHPGGEVRRETSIEPLFYALYAQYNDNSSQSEPILIPINIYDSQTATGARNPADNPRPIATPINTDDPPANSAAENRSSASNESTVDHRWIKVETNLLDYYVRSEKTTAADGEVKKTICYTRLYGGNRYLLQFGKQLIQLWRIPGTARTEGSASTTESEPATTENELGITGDEPSGELLFIHAYKAPYYGFTQTFRESWSLKGDDESKMEDNICFLQHNDIQCVDRIVLNIEMDTSENGENSVGHSSQQTAASDTSFNAELFIPFIEIAKPGHRISQNSLHLRLKSACQALHYLHKLKSSMLKEEVILKKMPTVLVHLFLTLTYI